MPYGQDAKIGVAFQTSHGTPVTDIGSFYPMPFLSESVTPEVPELISQNMQGRFDEGESFAGARNVGGTIANESQPISLGVALKAVCGSASSVVASDSIFTHEFFPATDDFDSNVINIPMTMHKNLADGGQVPVYQDLVGTRLELGCSNGEFLTAGLNLTGGSVATKTTSDDFGTLGIGGKKWTWDVTSVELGGVANVEFAELTIVQDEQASPRWTLQTTRDPARVKRDGFRQVRINGSIRFMDQTEYDNFLALTTQNLKITFTGPTEIQSGYYDQLTIEAPSFKYLSHPLEFADPSELIVGFEGKADYNVGSGHSIKYTVINTYANF
jgi:hypothetical protein